MRPTATRPIATAPIATAPTATAPNANANKLPAGTAFRRLVISRAMVPPSPSHQLQPFEAGVTLLADDDVVVRGNAERASHGNDLVCHLDIGLRRCGVAGVVDEDDGRCR